MVKRFPFTLVYAPQFQSHLETIDRRHYRMIRDIIAERLEFDPDVETTNRKPLEEPGVFDAMWELRFGPNNCFRAFYFVDSERREVHIVAIGVKDRNRLIIGGEELKSDEDRLSRGDQGPSQRIPEAQ